MREIHDELVHHLVPAHRARDPLDARIDRHFVVYLDQERQITFGMKKFLCSESMGIKQSRSGRISTTQLANGRPFWDGVSSHLAAPLRRGFFGRLPFRN